MSLNPKYLLCSILVTSNVHLGFSLTATGLFSVSFLEKSAAVQLVAILCGNVSNSLKKKPKQTKLKTGIYNYA